MKENIDLSKRKFLSESIDWSTKKIPLLVVLSQIFGCASVSDKIKGKVNKLLDSRSDLEKSIDDTNWLTIPSEEQLEKNLPAFFESIWGANYSEKVKSVDIITREEMDKLGSETAAAFYDPFTLDIKLSLPKEENYSIEEKTSSEANLEQISQEQALDFWSNVFHESAHANKLKLTKEYESLYEELDIKSTTDLFALKAFLSVTNILAKEQRNATKDKIYTDAILSETYAIFGSIYSGLKLSSVSSEFPIDEYLNQNLFYFLNNCREDIYLDYRLSIDIFAGNTIDISSYVAANFFALVILDMFGGDYQKAAIYLTETDNKSILKDILKYLDYDPEAEDQNITSAIKQVLQNLRKNLSVDNLGENDLSKQFDTLMEDETLGNIQSDISDELRIFSKYTSGELDLQNAKLGGLAEAIEIVSGNMDDPRRGDVMQNEQQRKFIKMMMPVYRELTNLLRIDKSNSEEQEKSIDKIDKLLKPLKEFLNINNKDKPFFEYVLDDVIQIYELIFSISESKKEKLFTAYEIKLVSWLKTDDEALQTIKNENPIYTYYKYVLKNKEAFNNKNSIKLFYAVIKKINSINSKFTEQSFIENIFNKLVKAYPDIKTQLEFAKKYEKYLMQNQELITEITKSIHLESYFTPHLLSLTICFVVQCLVEQEKWDLAEGMINEYSSFMPESYIENFPEANRDMLGEPEDKNVIPSEEDINFLSQIKNAVKLKEAMTANEDETKFKSEKLPKTNIQLMIARAYIKEKKGEFAESLGIFREIKKLISDENIDLNQPILKAISINPVASIQGKSINVGLTDHQGIIPESVWLNKIIESIPEGVAEKDKEITLGQFIDYKMKDIQEKI